MPTRATSSHGTLSFGFVARAASKNVRGIHAALAGRRRWNDEDIHHIRVLFKKLRALVHLGRGRITGKERRAWNETLGNSAKLLTSAREFSILKGWVETAVILAPPGHKRSLDPLLARLETDFPRRMAPGTRTMILETLDKFATVTGENWGEIAGSPRPGLLRTREKMAEKAREALAGGTPEAWHRWRRQVKYAAHQLEWIANAKKSKPTPLYRAFSQIGSALGKSNDMHNLRVWLARSGGKSALARYLDAWAEDAAAQWKHKAHAHWKKLAKGKTGKGN